MFRRQSRGLVGIKGMLDLLASSKEAEIVSYERNVGVGTVSVIAIWRLKQYCWSMVF